MCGGRVSGGAGSSDNISTSASDTESGERGVGPASGSWISMSELRRIIVKSRARCAGGEELGGVGLD